MKFDLLPTASIRNRTGEVMDEPEMPISEHREMFLRMAWVNSMSGMPFMMLRPMISAARRKGLTELSLLDVACGGGDVPLKLARLGRWYGLSFRLTLLDRSSVATQLAAQRAKDLGIPCRVFTADIVHEDLSEQFDIVTSSHFLHHLDRPDAVNVLRRLYDAARHQVVIGDVRRSALSLAIIWGWCQLFSRRNKAFRHDGVASVHAAWNPAEMVDLAREAGLPNPIIKQRFPLRIVLSCEK